MDVPAKQVMGQTRVYVSANDCDERFPKPGYYFATKRNNLLPEYVGDPKHPGKVIHPGTSSLDRYTWKGPYETLKECMAQEGFYVLVEWQNGG